MVLGTVNDNGGASVVSQDIQRAVCAPQIEEARERARERESEWERRDGGVAGG